MLMIEKERNQTSLFMTKKVREVHVREEDKLLAGEAVLKCCDNSFVKGGRRRGRGGAEHRHGRGDTYYLSSHTPLHKLCT